MLYLKLHTKIKIQTSIYSCQKMCCAGSLDVVSRDRRCTQRSTLCIVLQNCSATHRLLLFIADLIFSFRAQHTGTLGKVKVFRRPAKRIRRSSGLLFFIFSAVLFLFANKTQVQQFKKGCLKQCYTRLNHECTYKTQFAHKKVKYALKVSSCDTPLSKILNLTILASNASSNSTKVFKCPHTKNDSIFTHNGLMI
ncbi:hypothetical protein H5410_036852 [Solanum commersonii]|uniref:Uncharacterized protein n=1 Tax=Solanum commersonii TaxID=4109 RepID=A0A9J5Y8K8_SOLCO|nr:hypothetical protein H5410_036852 [Solanum commersonii]